MGFSDELLQIMLWARKIQLSYDPVISRRQASLRTELASSSVGIRRDVSFHVYNTL